MSLGAVGHTFERKVKAMIAKHILNLDCGIICVMSFNEENAEMDCYWDPGPPFTKAQFEQIKKHYIPWRDQIVQKWSERTGLKIMVITI